jgi:hypothetical protein
VELYRWRAEAPLDEGAPLTTLGSVSVSASSPVPGEWTVATEVPILVAPLSDADPVVRLRVFAWAVAQALAGRSTWAEVQALGRSVVRESGPARELQAWAERLGS